MKHRGFGRLFITDMILFGGTRVALGMGAGLLLSRRLNGDQRKAAGIALAAVGGLTTIPLIARFRTYKQWRKDQSWRQHEGECICGCPYCSQAEEEPKPVASPAA